MVSADIPDLVVRGQRILAGDAPKRASIHIRAGVITAVAGYDEVPAGCALFDTKDSVVMPGLVDTHVHINEPGRAEWEGFTTATHAAASGGVTTLIEMPLNSIPPTTTAANFRAKLAAAAGKLWVDVGFWGGVIPGNLAELRPLWDEGVFGFKCFLVPSGVEEFPHASKSDLRATLPQLVSSGAVLLAHSELPGPIEKAAKGSAKVMPTEYSSWLEARPREAENEAIALLVALAREFKARVHVVHLSSADALPLLRAARASGVGITVETCPHYLYFAAEEIADRATEFKCAPPIREAESREMLWAALGEGVIDFVVTDHSPCPSEMKAKDTGDFMKAWGGISSLGLSLSIVWTEAKRRGFAVSKLVDWMCRGPARLAGLEKRKGAIAVGYDADLVVWNPEASFRVEPTHLHQRHKLTPYNGRELSGVVEATFLRGRKIYDRGEFSSGPVGAALLRGKQ